MRAEGAGEGDRIRARARARARVRLRVWARARIVGSMPRMRTLDAATTLALSAMMASRSAAASTAGMVAASSLGEG